MKFLKSLLLLTIVLLSTNCSGDDEGPMLIEFETLEIGDQSSINLGRSQHVLNSAADYEQLFGTAPTGIDFNEETVIAVFLGTVGNDGNTYEITEITDQVSHITVTITWRIPRVPAGPNTNHYHVIKTRRLYRSVNFSTLEIRE